MAAGEEYVAAITAHEPDRRARRAFQDLALAITTPGGCIFDFGAGPGIDAKFYAGRGFRTLAYDVDPRMCAAFARHCAREIASGQVQLYEGDYRQFLDRQIPAIRERYDIDVITANFAPLCLIDDLRELFAGFHTLTAPRARLLASVLNPDFLGDMRYGWWWAKRLEYWRRGSFHVAGTNTSIYRRSQADFVAQAAPYFTLKIAVRGLPGTAVSHVKPRNRMSLLTSRYTFLLFEKQ